jgi:hypothetical protein
MKKLFLFAAYIFFGQAAHTQTTAPLTKTAWLTNETGKLMQAYPNPAIDEVTVQHLSSTQRAVIAIISTDGKLLHQKTVLPNTLQTKLNIGMLNKGIYILRFDDSKGDVRTLQLVKK